MMGPVGRSGESRNPPPGRGSLRRIALTLVGAAAAVAPTGLKAQESHLLIVVGLGGDATHRETFHDLAVRLAESASDPLGLDTEKIYYLGERPEEDPDRITGRSSRDGIVEVLGQLSDGTPTDAQVTVVFIGHGSERDGEARINLPGPDLTAAELASLLDTLGNRHLTVIQTTSASGGFLEPLSREGRVVMTATRSAREGNETRFPEHLVDAFSREGSDTDKDGRVSMLEAFTYARIEVARTYERDGTLLTEHALLDDNGDGVGTAEPPEDGGDGAVAGARYLAPGAGRPTVAEDPALAGLYARRDSLQQRLTELRAVKDALEAQEYETRLEDLLVEVALINREIRAREGGGE